MADTLLTLVRGDRPANEVLAELSGEADFANLLHGLLALYDNAARAIHTDLGLIAIGSWLSEIATHDTNVDTRGAAHLILAYNAATSPTPDRAIDLYGFGAQTFNDAIDASDSEGRATELLLAVADVWRRLLPELHTKTGLLALQQIEETR